jgi:hypothetical protein
LKGASKDASDLSLSVCFQNAPPVVELQLGVGQQLVAVEEQGEGLEVDVARLKAEKKGEGLGCEQNMQFGG